MADQASSEPRMFDLNRPQGYAKDDYLWQWKVANDTIFDIIRKSNGGQNTRDIMVATMFSASLIAHDDLRRKQEILFHSAVDHIYKFNGWSQERLIKEITLICEIDNNDLSPKQKAERISRLFNNNPMSADQKADELLRICSITMGNLTSYVDQFRGLAHTLKVGELFNQEKPYAGIKHAFGKQPDKPDGVIVI